MTPATCSGAKDLLKSKGADARVIAKIEKPEALEQLTAIVQAADGLMIARGDLGVEIDVARVPVVQKQIIALANAYQKPVITATQMLDSMQHSPRPTRAEASDVANAIFDGTDACMLSGETAIGKYPREAVEMMNRIALVTEAASATVEHRVSMPTKYAVGLHEITAAVVAGKWAYGSTASRAVDRRGQPNREATALKRCRNKAQLRADRRRQPGRRHATADVSLLGREPAARPACHVASRIGSRISCSGGVARVCSSTAIASSS